MRAPKLSLLISSFAVMLFSVQLPVSAHGAEIHVNQELNANKIGQTDAVMRDLWISHAFWVRAVVAETLAGNADAAAAAEDAAVANAKQIAAAIEPIYGAPVEEQLFGLLAGHYHAVKQYLVATVDDSGEQQTSARSAMLANAEQIAAFLSRANPHLPIDAVRAMLFAHGGHHVLQIQQLHDKQYAQEAQTWDAMKHHMYGLADALTGAIAMQFPAKFK